MALQVMAPDRELELRGHVVQALAPVVAENVPAAHRDTTPVLRQYCPAVAAQVMQLDALVETIVPVGQVMQVVAVVCPSR